MNLAKDSIGVLECDATCEERKKEKALQKQKEEEEENAKYALKKKNRNNKQSGKTESLANKQANAAGSLTQTEMLLYGGALLVAILACLFIWTRQ